MVKPARAAKRRPPPPKERARIAEIFDRFADAMGGRKTASVVLNELDIEPAIAVDTHVFRVAHRLALSKGKTPEQVEADLMRIVPRARLTRAHHWLILHGRYVCVARKPKCRECIVA